MKDKDLPDFDADNDEEGSEWSRLPNAMTETIDAKNLWPSHADASGSHNLSDIKTSSFGELLDALPTPAAVIDRSGTIMFSNAAFGTVGADGAEVRGRPLSASLNPDNTSDVESVMHRMIEDRKTRVIEALIDIKDRTVWGRMHFRSIRIGKNRGALVIVEDLTAEKNQLARERKHRLELKAAHGQLEERVKERTRELAAANARLKDEIVLRVRVEQKLLKEVEFSTMALDSLPGIFYLCDEHGNLLRWNKDLERALGYSGAEISTRNVLDFFSDESRQVIEKGIRQIMINGKHSGEQKLISKEGRPIPYLLTGVRITINRKPCFLGMGIDISGRKHAEKALQESEIRYRTLFDESMDGIFITLKDGTLVNANQSFLDIFGSTRSEMIGRDFARNCFSPADWGKLLDEMERTGSVKDYAVELRRQDNQTIECRITATVRRAEDGTVLGYHGILRDVTAEVAAEKLIREQNVFLNSLLESLTHPFYVVDAESHRILHANSAARQVFASKGATCYSATQGGSQPCSETDNKCPLCEVTRKKRPVTLEQVRHDRHGNARCVEIHAYPIVDENGKISKVIKYTNDVTDRKRTEQALRESEERMRLLIESAPIGIGIVQDGSYLYANQALADIFGYDSPKALVGLSTRSLFHDSESDPMERQAGEPQHRPTSSPSIDMTGMRQNGESFDASIWSTAIDFQGKPCQLQFIIDMSTENTLRTQLFQAQKLEAVGTLAGGIAHDFNNILTIIQGFTELVLFEKNEGDSGYEDLQQVVRAAHNGADLVRSILTFSRKVEPQFRSTNLNEEVTRAQKLLGRTIPKMIEIGLILEEPLNRINADPGQIEQILLNLAVNAQHAMPNGGKMVIETKNVILDAQFCRLYLDLRPGPHVALTVTDSGHGMPPEVVKHVFEPFFSTKKLGEGTGLGLAMVFGIVKSHGGAITCRSEPGAGTSFEMYFPVNAEQVTESVEMVDATSVTGNETILVVDDEEPIRDLAVRMLSRAGYHVITAPGGPEALDIYRLRQQEISLVILDVIMPVMSGVQCLEKLLEIDPDVKVLVASGFTIDGDVKRIVESRSRGFVSKPLQMTLVLETVRRILDAGGN